ncbi:response regulator [Deltaproteobacteria bacterium TL4]
MPRILAIDDQKDNLLVLSTLLEDLMPDSIITVASSGREGIERIKQGEPDVILLDILMPQMDGFEVCQQLKKDVNTKHIPIIMLTAMQTDSNSRVKALELGADAFLAKPLEENELVAQINAMLRIKKAEDRLRKENVSLEEMVLQKISDLRKSEERYKLLFDSASEGILVTDLETLKFTDCNPALAAMLGYTQEELKQLGVDDIHPKAILSHGEESYTLPFQSESSFAPVVPCLRKDGTLIFVDINANQFLIHGKKHSVGFYTDITARLKTESEKNRLAKAVEQAAESILITDEKGTILYVNPAFVRTTGYKPSEVLGKNPRILKSGIQDQHFYQEMWTILKKGEVWSNPIINKNKKGDFYEEVMTISPIRNETGKITNYVGVNYDISRERILEKQLQQAQKNEAIGTLASGIAHDFNNILQGIVLTIDLAISTLPKDSKAVLHLEQSIQFSMRGASLVRQILTFSRQSDQKFATIKVIPVIKEILKMMRSTLPSTIEIKQNIPEACGDIQGNLTQIHQVILNLCTNASYAMKDRGGLLELTLAEAKLAKPEAKGLQPKTARYLKLTVRDTGTGMSKQVKKRIFDPFFTTKPQGEGTGLGLSVVQGIVQSHHGIIHVESQLNKGTTFDVYFPVIEAVEKPLLKDSKPMKIRGDEHLLVVDDEKIVATMEKEILENLGYQISLAYSGKEALSLLMENPGAFDLILTDQTMPEMRGEQLASKIKELGFSLPVILTTGFSKAIETETLQQKGIHKLIMKPFKSEELGRAIRQLLDEKASQSRAEA